MQMIYLEELNQYVKYLPISLFLIVKKDELFQNNLNSDLKKISEWALSGKYFLILIPESNRRRFI